MAIVQNLFSIDGAYYNVFIPADGIKRNFAVVDTDDAGRVITGEMERDIVGTYYNYTMELNTNFLSFDEYDDLYETLSAPVDYHVITVPYGQTTLTFKAYCTQGQDTLAYIRNGRNRWKDLSINFLAMEPERV